MDRDEVEVHKLAKKERGQYPAILTEQTWSLKDLYGLRDTAGSPERASILPARGTSHIIMNIMENTRKPFNFFL